MGSRLDGFKAGLDGAKTEQEEALKEGQEVVGEINHAEGILDTIDTSNLDDEVAAQVEVTRETAREEARAELEGNVASRLEKANSDAASISNEAKDMEQGAREGADKFSQVESTQFGSSGAEGVAAANDNAQEAADLSAEADDSIASSQAELAELLDF